MKLPLEQLLWEPVTPASPAPADENVSYAQVTGYMHRTSADYIATRAQCGAAAAQSVVDQ